MRKQSKKIGLTILISAVMFGIGLFITLPSEDSNDIREVYAMMESDASLEAKTIYLEKRVTRELTTLNMITSYSDLCSSKYLNELDSLSLSMSTTLEAYAMIEDNLSSSKNLSKKYDDYKKLVASYDKMIKMIHDEKYDEALELLTEVNDLRSTQYNGIENEISKLGSN